MISRVEIKPLATGVPGFDEVLGGGVPEFSFNLIAGPPGCGKTTLAHQIMFARATPECPALYFTVLGEPPLKMLRYQQQFDFFDMERVNRSIHFVNLADEALTGNLDEVLSRIVSEVKARGPGLVFVDSFRSVVMASRASSPDTVLQRFVQHLGMEMTSWQATTFLVGEFVNEADPNPVFAVADGLIWLRQSAQGDSVVRKMEVVKMRGMASMPGLHTFRIRRDGIEVFPPARFEPRPLLGGAATEAALRTGVPGLDEMLGGGLPLGYSALVAGPSGSGKTILATAFLAEGARLGETGVVAVFDQQLDDTRNRLLARLIRDGQVRLVEPRSSDLSIDEVVAQLTREVRQCRATRVVIDSLSGFELSLAPTFREDFRQSMLRLVGSLSNEGVTVLMTTELEDRYTDLRFSPYGTAFLTDALIVQRYIEVESRLQRVMGVVKLRARAHSDALRQYRIDQDGIQVGEVLDRQEGLLGGRPTRRQNRASETPPAGRESGNG